MWYLKKNGSVSGPFSEGEIRRRLAAHAISYIDQVSTDGASWRRVGTVSTLLHAPLSASESTTAASPNRPAPSELKSAPASVDKAGVPTMDKANDAGKIEEVPSDENNRIDKSDFFMIVVKTLFVFTCLLAIVTLAYGMYAAFAESRDPHGSTAKVFAGLTAPIATVLANLGINVDYEAAKSKPWLVLLPFFCEAGFAYLLWWLGTRKEK